MLPVLVTVKMYAVVPALPSLWLTSSIEMFGAVSSLTTVAAPLALLIVEFVAPPGAVPWAGSHEDRLGRERLQCGCPAGVRAEGGVGDEYAGRSCSTEEVRDGADVLNIDVDVQLRRI